MSVTTMEPRYTSDGQGMLRQDRGVFVLHLEGTEEQMARQHAELLHAEIRQGILPFAAQMLTAHLQPGGDLLSRVGRRLGRALLESLCLTVARNMPAEYRRMFHTLIDW